MKTKKSKNYLFISFVIAAYNEKGNVERLFLKINDVMEKLGIKYEIVGVIEGNDGSYESLKKIKKDKKWKELKLFYEKKPLGLGNAFKKGFNLSDKKATHVITMDADWNHDPEEISILFSRMKNNIDIVIGSRNCKGAKTTGIPIWKKVLSNLMNLIFNIITDVNIKDKTSGYRLYKKEALDKIKNEYSSKNFEFLPEILIIAQKKGLNIVEAPINFKFRTIGKSKLEIFKTTKGYSKLLIRTIFRRI